MFESNQAIYSCPDQQKVFYFIGHDCENIFEMFAFASQKCAAESASFEVRQVDV